MKKLNAIIVHGAYGHPQENWFAWLQHQLLRIGINCHVPQLPTPQGQTLDHWLETFNRDCRRLIFPHSILIGHSLGAAFILKWLEQCDLKLRSVILVGAFLGNIGLKQFDLINQSFFDRPVNWQLIKSKSEQFVCFHGDNDGYVPRYQLECIAKNLYATKIIIANAGHINAAAGFTTFPHLLIHIQQLMEQGHE